jgi:hypothetical protein
MHMKNRSDIIVDITHNLGLKRLHNYCLLFHKACEHSNTLINVKFRHFFISRNAQNIASEGKFKKQRGCII